MKHRDVILDFTSLLDIILIILFFFILYSAFDVEASAREADAARAAYREKLAALAGEEEELNRERERLNDEWERLLGLDENAVKNQQALNAFGGGSMLSFHLRKEDDSEDWELRALRKSAVTGEDEVAGVIRRGEYDDLSDAILRVLDEASFTPDDVVIIAFTYDGSVLGTNRVYAELAEAFGRVQAARKNVYLNAINISR